MIVNVTILESNLNSNTMIHIKFKAKQTENNNNNLKHPRIANLGTYISKYRLVISQIHGEINKKYNM